MRIALWPSRTVSWAPFLISLPWAGKRHARVSRVEVLGQLGAAGLRDELADQPDLARVDPVTRRQVMQARREGFDLVAGERRLGVGGWIRQEECLLAHRILSAAHPASRIASLAR